MEKGIVGEGQRAGGKVGVVMAEGREGTGTFAAYEGLRQRLGAAVIHRGGEKVRAKGRVDEEQKGGWRKTMLINKGDGMRVRLWASEIGRVRRVTGCRGGVEVSVTGERKGY